MFATALSISTSAPLTNGSWTSPTRASSKTQVPRYLYGAMTLMVFTMPNVEVRGPPGRAHQAPPAHTVFQRPCTAPHPVMDPSNDCQSATSRGARVNVRRLRPANTAAFTAWMTERGSAKLPITAPKPTATANHASEATKLTHASGRSFGRPTRRRLSAATRRAASEPDSAQRSWDGSL